MKRIWKRIQEELQEMWGKPLSLIGWLIGVAPSIGALVLTIAQKIDFYWLIIAEAILIGFLLWKYFSLKKQSIMFDDLYIDKVPMISSLSYIMNTKKREHYNNFDILEAVIRYKYNKAAGPVGSIAETVTWDFYIRNNSQEAITSMIMMVSKSVFSQFENIKLTAMNTETKQSLHLSPKAARGSQKYVEIVFDGRGIAVGEVMHLQLKMQWTKIFQLIEPDFLIVDPMNYSLKTQYVRTIFETDSEDLANVPVQYLSVDRKLLAKRKPVYNTCIQPINNGIYGFSHSFTPEKNRLYLIKIDYTPKNETAVEDEAKNLVGSAH